MKYIAKIKTTDNRELLVRASKKNLFFRSIEQAEKRLELWGKRGVYGQGRIYDYYGNKLIYTIAL